MLSAAHVIPEHLAWRKAPVYKFSNQ